MGIARAQATDNWRGGGGGGDDNGGGGGSRSSSPSPHPSSALFNTPRRTSGMDLRQGGGSNGNLNQLNTGGQPSSALFATPRRNTGSLMDLRQGGGGNSKNNNPQPSSSLFATPRRNSGSLMDLRQGGGNSSNNNDQPTSTLFATPRRSSSACLARGSPTSMSNNQPLLSLPQRSGSMVDLKNALRSGSTTSLMAKMQSIKQSNNNNNNNSSSSNSTYPDVFSLTNASLDAATSALLLGPDAFSCSPKPSPKVTRRGSQTNIRQPCGPDGTRGFAKRSSMFDLASVVVSA